MFRNHRTGGAVFAATILISALTATAAPQIEAEAPEKALLDAYPGVLQHRDGPNFRMFYGQSMTKAGTPQEAADLFVARHRAAFGVSDLTLSEFMSHTISHGRLTVYTYRQEIDGLTVENSLARVLVNNGPRSNDVFYAAAKVVESPQGGFAPMTLTADDALASIQQRQQYAGLSEWSQPELVVFAGIEEVDMAAPVRAWKFRGNNTNLADHEAYTFFVDAATGALVHRRNEVIHVDVSGNVSGFATPGTKPDIGSNPEVQVDIEDIRVTISGDPAAYTDANGDYTITHAGSSSVTVNTGVLGRWVNVNNQDGSDLSASLVVTPPGPADFVLNASGITEQTTAQMNALIHTNATHNFYKALQPTWNALDTVMPANVNILDTCNAYYNGSSINFYLTGGGCRNSAYSTIVAHEYGHHIVNRLGLQQAAFGEGFSDCVAMLEYNTHIMGEDFCGTGCHIRRPELANVQYPCSDPTDPFRVHFCGQVLGGTVWDLRMNLGASLGEPAGLDVARQLWSDWSQITSGPASGQAAHPGTAIEFLMADDTDTDISNGTPHMFEICNAFNQHSIDCPTVILGDMVLPNGAPEFAAPDTTFTVQANAVPLAGTPDPNTGKVYFRIGGSGPYTEAAMSQLAPNEYEATLPGSDCEEVIEYYFSYDDVVGITVFEPDLAPNSVYSTTYALSVDEAASYDFETAAGWTASGPASAGPFQRGTPVGGLGAPDADYDGSGQCWVTGLAAGVDLDGGPAFLTSPAIDISGMTDPYVTYARWFSNDAGANPSQDSLSIEASHNNGTNWFFLESVGPSGLEASGGWFKVKHRILDSVPALSTEFKIRLVSFDSPSQDSNIEIGLDAMSVFDIVCEEVGGPCGDFDNDGDVDLADFGVFTQCFGGSFNPPAVTCPPGADADCDDDGDVDLADFATFSQNFTGSL